MLNYEETRANVSRLVCSSEPALMSTNTSASPVLVAIPFTFDYDTLEPEEKRLKLTGKKYIPVPHLRSQDGLVLLLAHGSGARECDIHLSPPQSFTDENLFLSIRWHQTMNIGFRPWR